MQRRITIKLSILELNKILEKELGLEKISYNSAIPMFGIPEIIIEGLTVTNFPNKSKEKNKQTY